MSLLDGLFAYWAFDPDGVGGVSFVDSHASNWPLRRPGGNIALAAGKISGSARFDSGSLSFDGQQFFTGDWAFSLWVNPSALPDYAPLLNAVGFNLYVNTDGSLSLNDRVSTSDIEGVGHCPIGAWSHLVATRSGSQTSLYVNGVLVGTTTQDVSPNGVVSLGHLSLSNWSYDGQMDELAVYVRTLSPADIAALYNGGAGKAHPFDPRLVGGQLASGTIDGIYYVAGYPATSYIGGTYYFWGTPSTLDSEGNGVWNDVVFVSGRPVHPPLFGWSPDYGFYYINGEPTPLDEYGDGGWNGLYYASGYPAFGFFDGVYYIDGVATTLDSEGNGFWGGVYYEAGQQILHDDGWDPATNTYWLAGVATTLTEQGTGSWLGLYYVGGQQTSLATSGAGVWNSTVYVDGSPVGVVFAALPEPSDVRAGVTYGITRVGTLEATPRSQLNLAALLGLPPLIKI